MQKRFVLLKKPEMNALGKALLGFWGSSIGKKLIVAVTGVMLVGFLIAHMVGNLLIFQGRESLNDYGYFLHHFLHGWGIWIFRLGLLGAFALHLVATIALVRENRAARNTRYAYDATVQAPRSSRMMIWSGLTVLGFVIFHLLHFTVRIDPDLAKMKDPMDPSRHDVYGMVIAGFQSPIVVLFYIVAVSFFCTHLNHGISSLFQTLGLRSEKTRWVTGKIGIAVTLILWLGFISIPFLTSVNLLKDEGVPEKSAAHGSAVETISES
ncbi:MAG: succinate dehydrogenase cytochrome b subunit [Verrucomicrobiales bacterium]|nr:succinate dehydrogenase cytochrome b subunit [Verrucomicrobiales bacterium]